MKQFIRTSFLLLLVLFLLSGCISVSSVDTGMVIGTSYELQSGETRDGDMTVIGGNVTIEQDATLEGDLAVMGGTVTIDGTVDGDVSIVGGTLTLEDHAVIRGDLSDVGATVHRSSQAVVEGNETSGRPWRVTTMRTPPLQVSFDPIGGPIMAIFQALAMSALAVLVMLFAAAPLDRTGRTALAQPVVSGGVGVLTAIVAPPLLLLVMITIILIPVGLLGILVLAIAGLFGWLSLGLVVGRQLAVWLKQNWSEPVMAGVGAGVLSLVASMMNIIPCLGPLVNILIGLIGLGAVVLTRFGTQMYPPYGTPNPRLTPDAPPAPTSYGARVYETPAEPPAENRPDDRLE